MVQRHPFTRSQALCLRERQSFRVVSRCKAPARPVRGPEGLWAGFRGVSHTCWRSMRSGTGSRSSGGEASDRAAAVLAFAFGVAFGGCLGFTFGAMLGWRW